MPVDIYWTGGGPLDTYQNSASGRVKSLPASVGTGFAKGVTMCERSSGSREFFRAAPGS